MPTAEGEVGKNIVVWNSIVSGFIKSVVHLPQMKSDTFYRTQLDTITEEDEQAESKLGAPLAWIACTVPCPFPKFFCECDP